MSDEVTAEDFQAILAQLRDWVRTKVVPREREIADADAIPDDLRKQAADMGLFGYAIPQEWGGLGLDLSQDVELAMELGYTSLAVRSMFGTNNGIAGQVLVNFGTDEQKAAWLGRLASGAVVASFALTEPGAGSNPAGLQTRAGRVDDDSTGDWIIDGQKRFITNAPSADLFVVFARTRPADASGTGIAVFLVPADTPGVEVGAKDRKMGQEGAWTSDVVFSDVRVPASALVGGDADAGYRAAMTSLARGRVHIAALAVGTAQRALDESVAYAASATQGGTVIGEFQLVQAMLADQQTGVLAGRALVRETAARYVSGEDRRIGPSAAKVFCTEMAGQVADLAVQIHGGSGYMRDMPVERIYRDVRLLRLYEGTSEIQRLIIGGGLVRAQQRRLPGLDADAGQGVHRLSGRLATGSRHPSARLGHARLDGLEPGQHRRHIGGVVIPEPGMGGGLLQSAGEFHVLVVPGGHDQPGAPGRPAHVLGAHGGGRVGRQEMEHRGQDNGHRLGQVDHGGHPRIREHGLRLGQVRPHGGEPLAAGKQRLPVNHRHRVYVHIADPGVRVDLSHRLVHGRVRGQSGAKVEELADARGGRASRRRADELPVVPDQLRQRRVHLGHPPAHIPVGSEIVLPAQPVVVDTGDAGPGHIDARGGNLVRHGPQATKTGRALAAPRPAAGTRGAHCPRRPWRGPRRTAAPPRRSAWCRPRGSRRPGCCRGPRPASPTRTGCCRA
jgi:acyl-CoA dehydrogenase